MNRSDAVRTIKELARSTYSAEGRSALDMLALKAIRIHRQEDPQVHAAVEALGLDEAAAIYVEELEERAQ